MKKLTVALFVVCLLALAGPAWAGVVFDNYPINSTIQAFAINFGYSVSDSFTTDPGGHTVTGVNFGSWNVSGDDITAVDWMIGTTPFSSTGGGSGTAAAVTDTLQVSLSPNPDSYNIYSNSINLLGEPSLAPGTYYLTLENAVFPGGNQVYWDVNDGAGIDAQQNQVGELSFTNCGGAGIVGGGTDTGTCAESFQILGNASATPEPGSLMLFGSGILLLAGAWRRKASR